VSVFDPSPGDTSLADLIADAAKVRLPAPRSAASPTGARPPRVIDLRLPAPRPLEIPAATIDLVEGYADSHL
jgi:hypothetical protein